MTGIKQVGGLLPVETGWYVPGGAVINDEGVKMRLRPPKHWTRKIIVIEKRPPSMNDNSIRSNWRGFHKQKKLWQEEIEILLMQQIVARNYKRAVVGCRMQLERKFARDPDPSNYRGLVDKACGDALVNYGAIPDDDEAHYFFGGVEWAPMVPKKPRTWLWMFFQPKEA